MPLTTKVTTPETSGRIHARWRNRLLWWIQSFQYPSGQPFRMAFHSILVSIQAPPVKKSLRYTNAKMKTTKKYYCCPEWMVLDHYHYKHWWHTQKGLRTKWRTSHWNSRKSHLLCTYHPTCYYNSSTLHPGQWLVHTCVLIKPFQMHSSYSVQHGCIQCHYQLPFVCVEVVLLDNQEESQEIEIGLK